MDPFSDRRPHILIRQRDEKIFHYSPAHEPEDVVCGGSDTEETEDEVRRKRLRYEDQASRYIAGQRPILQSANLRGPLSKESGWVNPWRYRRSQEERWWRPGAGDMLFTKADVMKRAADHGLGHLSPADALSWCKSTAEAEATSGLENGEDFDQTFSTTARYSENFPQYSNEEDERSGWARLPHHSATPHQQNEDEDEEGIAFHRTKTGGRGAKRHIDSEWLKGSYVSKRARWDGPALSTPTPNSDLQVDRRRHQKPPLRNSQIEPTYHSANSVPDQSQRSSVVHRTDVEGADIEDYASRPTPAHFTSTNLNITPGSSQVTLNADLSEFWQEVTPYTGSQEDTALRLELDLTTEAQKRTPLDTNQSPAKFTTDTHSPASPLSRERRMGVTSTQKEIQYSDSPRISPNTLPKLPTTATTLTNGRPRSEYSSEDEISFVTEVAPSSQNVEQFQYRKKRTKLRQMTAAASPESGDHVSTSEPKVSKALDAEDETPRQSISAPQILDFDFTTQNSSVAITPVSHQPQTDVSTSKRNSSFYDQDRTVDPFQTPESPRIATEAPLLPALDNFTSLFSQSGLGMDYPEFGKSSLLLPQSSEPPTISSQEAPSQSLPGPSTMLHKSPALLKVSPKMRKESRAFDSSTQSYNTTPIRSGRSAKFAPRSSGKARELDEEEGNSATMGPERIRSVTREPRDESLQKVVSLEDPSIPHTEVQISQNLETETPEKEAPEKESLEKEAPEKETPEKEFCEEVRNERQKSEEILPQSGLLEESPLEATMTKEVQPELEDEEQPAKANSEVQTALEDTNSPDSPDGEAGDEDLASQPTLNSEQESDSNSNHSSPSSLDVEYPEAETDLPENNLDTASPAAQRAPDVEVAAVSATPKADAPKTPKAASQVLGPGEQTPWASVKIAPLSKSTLLRSLPKSDTSISSYKETSLHQQDSPSQSSSQGEESGWQRVNHSPTHYKERSIPLQDITASPSPASSNSVDLPSTQLLFEAALNNPWTSNLDTSTSKRRPSLSVSSEGSEGGTKTSFSHQSPPGSLPPPEPVVLFEEDSFDDDTMVVSFGDPFTIGRQPKLIPEHNSQVDSSPAVGAQAQAFVAADQEALLERETHKTLSPEPSCSPRPRNETMDNLVWEDNATGDTSFEGSIVVNPHMEGLGHHESTFDMADALGEAGFFLEDWSVDAELKKAKALDLSKDAESNGAKRRRLFGIL